MHGLAAMAFAAAGAAALAHCDEDRSAHDSLPAGKVCDVHNALDADEQLSAHERCSFSAQHCPIVAWQTSWWHLGPATATHEYGTVAAIEHVRDASVTPHGTQGPPMLEKTRKDVFYKYEKRIRELSTQEKVLTLPG